MFEKFQRWLIDTGVTEGIAVIMIEVIEVLGVAVLAFVANWITKSIILRVVHQAAKRTRTDWDDVLVKRRVFQDEVNSVHIRTKRQQKIPQGMMQDKAEPEALHHKSKELLRV